MKWISMVLVVIFSVSCLGAADIYARQPEAKQWDAPDIEPEERIDEMVPPEPGPSIPHPEDYELWQPPVPEPGPVPKPIPVPEPVPAPGSGQGGGPTENPEKWAMPEGTRMTKPAGEMQTMPGIAAPSGAPGEGMLAVGASALYVIRYGMVRAATWPGSNLSLLVMGLGNISILEYIWVPGMGWRPHPPGANIYNPGPNRWSRMWFYADVRGWHALRAFVGNVPSNWVYIYVY